MAPVLLDTNAVSDLMRGTEQLKSRIAGHPERIATSVVVVGELRYGLNRMTPGRKLDDLEARAQAILSALWIEVVSEPVAHSYGMLKARLQSRGIAFDDNDLWIAATAAANGYLLVTRDQAFGHVAEIQVENWCE